MQTTSTFDHDKLFGILWSEYVDRFYKGMEEWENRQITMTAWHEKTEGWCVGKPKERLTLALAGLMGQYYQTFSPDDGARVKSEEWLEDDLFVGRLDGLGDKLVHEVKTTSRCPMISEQLWKVQNSLQVKLYCVMAEADQVIIEFGFKDPPYMLYRGPTMMVSALQRESWRRELETLARYINSLGEEPTHYICHPDGCCLTTKYMVSMCPYQTLCAEGLNDTTRIAYKTRETR